MRLEGLVLRERALAGAALVALIALSWLYLLAGAGMDMRGTAMPMIRAEWTPGYFGVMFAMWAVMMAAMMLPGAAPMVLLHARIARERRDRVGAVLASALFVLGYVAVWGAFSAGATLAQWWLDHMALLSPMMKASDRMLAGGLLVAAGPTSLLRSSTRASAIAARPSTSS